MDHVQFSEQSECFNQQFHISQISHNQVATVSHPNTHSNPDSKKFKDRQSTNISKENQSKHINAIKPYVSGNHKQRKISKRQSHKNIPNHGTNSQSNASNTSEGNSKGKNKKGDPAHKKLQESMNGKNIGDLYWQLSNIKAEYKTLKNSYNGLVKQNTDLTERGEKEAASIAELRRQIEKWRKEEEKHRKNVKFMEHELERVRKESVRMVETQKYKNKKLEETLQEKQLMIAYLRSQLSVLQENTGGVSTSFFFQHTAPTYLKHTATNSKALSNQGNYTFNKFPSQNSNQAMAPSLPVDVPSGNRTLFQHQEQVGILNQSLISSIHNGSIIDGRSELIDLPRQMRSKKQAVYVYGNKSIKEPQGQPICASGCSHIHQMQRKRQYIFSNQDDSLSFSYEKSKQSIKQNEDESLHSRHEDPSILTFTKKDVYIIDEDSFLQIKPEYQKQQITSKVKSDKNFIQKETDNLLSQKSVGQNSSSQLAICSNIQLRSKQRNSGERVALNEKNELGDNNEKDSSEEKSEYSGSQQILTFEKRFVDNNSHQELFQLINPGRHKQHKQTHQKAQDSAKHKKKQRIDPTQRWIPGQALTHQFQEQKQAASKSKLHTKRLQIFTDQVGSLLEHKEISIETGKRHASGINNIKTGKKKLSRKRKSEEGGTSMSKK